jgi:hypothetical protein
MAVSFDVLSNLLFTDHSIIGRYIDWRIESVLKYTKNRPDTPLMRFSLHGEVVWIQEQNFYFSKTKVGWISSVG